MLRSCAGSPSRSRRSRRRRRGSMPSCRVTLPLSDRLAAWDRRFEIPPDGCRRWSTGWSTASVRPGGGDIRPARRPRACAWSLRSAGQPAGAYNLVDGRRSRDRHQHGPPGPGPPTLPLITRPRRTDRATTSSTVLEGGRSSTVTVASEAASILLDHPHARLPDQRGPPAHLGFRFARLAGDRRSRAPGRAAWRDRQRGRRSGRRARSRPISDRHQPSRASRCRPSRAEVGNARDPLPRGRSTGRRSRCLLARCWSHIAGGRRRDGSSSSQQPLLRRTYYLRLRRGEALPPRWLDAVAANRSSRGPFLGRLSTGAACRPRWHSRPDDCSDASASESRGRRGSRGFLFQGLSPARTDHRPWNPTGHPVARAR